jgi:hypothetical protein
MVILAERGISATPTGFTLIVGNQLRTSLLAAKSLDYYLRKDHWFGSEPLSHGMLSTLPSVGENIKSEMKIRIDANEMVDRDDQLWPAGRHVPQTSGEPSAGLSEWIGEGTESIDDTNVVLWHTFGVTHFPAPEDFPVMPVEPMMLLLKPRNFFNNNPVMDVPPSFCSTPSQVAAKGQGAYDAIDKASTLAFQNSCCTTNAATTNGTKPVIIDAPATNESVTNGVTDRDAVEEATTNSTTAVTTNGTKTETIALEQPVAATPAAVTTNGTGAEVAVVEAAAV